MLRSGLICSFTIHIPDCGYGSVLLPAGAPCRCNSSQLLCRLQAQVWWVYVYIYFLSYVLLKNRNDNQYNQHNQGDQNGLIRGQKIDNTSLQEAFLGHPGL